MSQTRSKRRTKSQRIGEKGHGIFRSWATDNGLVPQETKPDYGIDFFCQVMQPIDKDSEEATGSVIGVQVRSTAGKAQPRVTLDRTDVESALRLSMPYCLVAVDIREGKVYYLFLGEHLLRKLHSFLASEKASMSLRLEEFESGSENFRRSLAKACTPASQSRLQLVKAELKISSDISGAKIKVLQTTGSGLAIVDVPWITQIFQIDSDRHEKIRAMVFEQVRLPSLSFKGLSIKPTFEPIESLVDGPIVFRGAIEEEVELYVRHDQKYTTAHFALRRVEDERAYVSESGLVLIISDPRLNGDVHKHFMGLRINASNASPLFSNAKTLQFLKMLQPGAVSNEVGREGIPVATWTSLERIGPFVSAVETVYNYLDCDVSDVFLADLSDVEFGKTITLIEALINGIGIERMMPSFILGPAAESPPESDSWHDAGFRIPIITNLKDRGVEIWVEGTGHVYIHGEPGVICGFRAGKQNGWEYHLRDTPFDKGQNPEVLVCEHWPEIPISFETRPEEGVFKGGIEHPLQGEIWPLREE